MVSCPINLRLGSWAAVLVVTALASFGRADDWPQWRGPTHDALVSSEPLVDDFPPEGPPILWVRELGQGYSGFAVVDGKAYTQAQSLYQQSLFCLDAKTGKTLWSYEYAWPYDGGGLYPGPRSTPTVQKGRVYFCSPQGVAMCVSAGDGKLVWSVSFNEQFGGRGTEFGYSASPLVIDGLVILPVGGKQAGVIALKTLDGSLAWKAGSRPASYATPLPLTWKKEPLIVVLMQNSLTCVHRTTGEVWWEHPLSSGYDEHAAAPIYREPFLFISSPFHGGADCFRLAADEQTGRCKPVPIWLNKKLSNDTASSVLYENTLYGFDLREAQARLHRPSRGEFRAVDFLTGKIHWSSAEPGHAQVIAADGKLVVFNDRGEVILARANPAQYEELGRVSLFADEVCWTAPAMADGRLFVRTQTRAACIYLGAQPLEPAAARLTASAIPHNSRLDTASLLGAERDYPATVPELAEFQRWFGWCAAAIAIASLATGSWRWVRWVRYRKSSANEASPFVMPRSRAADALFWLLLLAAGLTGSPLLHRLQAAYIFTWPLALWAAFEITLLCSFAGSNSPFWSRARALSYATGLVFLALCALYFHLCRSLGLAIEWTFLTGFGWSFPVAALAAWLPFRRLKWSFTLETFGWVASFSLYYWSSVLFVVLWLRR